MNKIFKKLYILLISLFIGITPITAETNKIELKQEEIILGKGYSEMIKYNLASDLNDSNIIWSSSNAKVATVDDNGKVTAITNGTTIITASINGYSATCTVIVSSNYVSVQEIEFNNSNLNILVGASDTLKVTIKPSNASNKDITWTSNNPSVVTVNSSGNITAKKVGTAVITASLSGNSTTCVINVVDTVSLKSIKISKSSLTMKEQSSEKLNIIYNPSNATNKKVTWKSSNTNIATVDSNGKITAKQAGTVTITAISNDGGFVSTCKVTVEALSKKVASVSLNKQEVNLVAGETETLKVTINPSYAENKNVKWESSDKSIATIKDGVITAVKEGTTEIKVISEDGNKEAICKVTVTAPPIKSIKFKTENQTITVGTNIKLITIAEPANSSIENAIWTSSDELVATVENGTVKALKPGTTIITISNEDNSIKASINITVVEKPKEDLKITIEGYNLNFDPKQKDYTLKIGNEEQLSIKTNINESKVTINGNQKLKDGSIITITINEKEKVTYIIKIEKSANYTIYFIAAISVLLLLNLIRILIKNKKK